jgi:hypothetical protein
LRRERGFAVFALALALAGGGCAMNVSETRPAKVLRGGEIQLAEMNDIVIPTRAVGGLIDGARDAANAADDRMLTPEERRTLIGAASAISLTGPVRRPHRSGGGPRLPLRSQARIQTDLRAVAAPGLPLRRSGTSPSACGATTRARPSRRIRG